MITEFGDVLIEGGGGGGGGASGSEELGIYGLLLILTEATSKRGRNRLRGRRTGNHESADDNR